MAETGKSGKKAGLVFAGGVALLVTLSFGLAFRGVYLSARDDLAGERSGDGAGKTERTKAGQGAAASAPAPSATAALSQGAQASSPPRAGNGSRTASASAPAANAGGPSSPTGSLAGFQVRRVLPVRGPFRHGDYVWDDKGVPAGPVVITIDLKAQTLSVFRDGYEIGTAVILYGATDKPSPLGVFPILQKDADHYSSTYDNAPMPYTLRLTNDGVAIHGADVVWGNATHGCIGVPTAFAKKLFGVARRGDPVIITNGKMMKLGKG